MMKTRGMILAVALFLASGLSVLALAGDDEPTPEAKAAAAAIQKLADDAGKKDWESITKDGSALGKKHDLVDVMNVLKLRKVDPKTKIVLGGAGVGKVPGKITPDGIEARIISLTKKPMVKATLDKEQADLIRMAEVTAAIAATAAHQCVIQAKMGKKDPTQWREWSKDMYESSQDLIKALKAKNTADIKTAANKLNTSCNECHGVFRDDK